jgi:hypothetical protein
VPQTALIRRRIQDIVNEALGIRPGKGNALAHLVACPNLDGHV